MDWSIDAKSHGKTGTFWVSSQAALFQGIHRMSHSDSSPINPSSRMLWDDFTREMKYLFKRIHLIDIIWGYFNHVESSLFLTVYFQL